MALSGLVCFVVALPGSFGKPPRPVARPVPTPVVTRVVRVTQNITSVPVFRITGTEVVVCVGIVAVCALAAYLNRTRWDRHE
jgi:hypothetical protein